MGEQLRAQINRVKIHSSPQSAPTKLKTLQINSTPQSKRVTMEKPGLNRHFKAGPNENLSVIIQVAMISKNPAFTSSYMEPHQHHRQNNTGNDPESKLTMAGH